MSATSRRTFLSGAAATTAATFTAGCNYFCPAPPAPAAPPTAAAAPPRADRSVALDFLNKTKFLDPALKGVPNAAVLMYGLVCVDVPGQELLMPNSTGLVAEGCHPHDGRIWVLSTAVPSGVTPDGTESGNTVSYWNTNGYAITLTPTDGGGTALAPLPGALTRRTSAAHPWTDMKWVRSITAITNLPIIPAGSRDNPALVASRVAMAGGTVTAVPPHSPIGLRTEWKVTPVVGTPIISASADAMLWHVGLPAGTAKVKLSLRKISDGTVRDILLNAPGGELAAVVTNASTTSMPPALLTDTKAFARLLVGGNPTTYPFATQFNNFQPSTMGSTSDGHCEGGSA